MATTITYEDGADMMRIENDGINIFEGNYSDFDKSPDGIQEFLSKLGITATLIEKDYDEWYD